MKFPIDMKPSRVIKALHKLGFYECRKTANSHIVLKHRENGESICLPNHKRLKMSTVSKELRNSGVDKKEFMEYY